MSSIFITGGSRGIGRSIVYWFAQQGWNVAFTYTSNKEAADATVQEARKGRDNIRISSYQMDLKSEKQVEEICEQVISDFTDIDVVVNSAAIVSDDPAALLSTEAWHNVIAVNLTGPFLVTRSFLLHFLSKRSGRFIHLSSLSAIGSSGQINYAASKAGLVGLSNTIAKEYGRKGITSNIVTVGYVPTVMTEESMNIQNKTYWMEHCPAGRVGTGNEIAATVYHLCSEHAGFINGENIRIAGGLTYVP